ncbi:MAG: magnesium/cobalt transporter CorA [Pirellulaceae bacterium]
MLHVLDVNNVSAPQVLSGTEAMGPPPEGTLRWVDLQQPSNDELNLLAQRFGFHPLSIEDCAHFDQRPKLEEYGDHLFLVTHCFELASDPNGEPRMLELHTFLSKTFLVTVHDEPLLSLSKVWDRLKADGAAARRGVDFIRYLIADAMVDALFPVVDQLAGEIEALEDSLLSRSPDPHNLENILRIKRLLVSLRRMIPGQRDVLALLTKRDEEYISEKTVPYFRDVYDHLLRVNESIEANRELLANVLDAHQWTVSQRTNVIMKRLTILSAVFLPLTFITGFFGQNFEGMPFGSNELMAAMLVSCAVVPTAMLWFFLRSKWL